jgi:hypothetical protein
MFKHPLRRLTTIAGAAALVYYFLEKSKQKMAEQPVSNEAMPDEPDLVIDLEPKPTEEE